MNAVRRDERRHPTGQCVRFVLSAMLFCQVHAFAQLGPQPPCGREPVPPYPGLGDSASVKSWSTSELGRDWRPPACTGWAAVGFTTLVTTVARFRYTSAEGLLSHIGAISDLAGVRYWSTTHQRWQTLIEDAHALTGSQPADGRRRDFTAAEMTQGKVLYFEQVDNLSGKGIYRMHIAESSASRLVFDVENVSVMRYLHVPLVDPGEMQSVYFLDRESDDVWRYYSVMRAGRTVNRRIAGNESSSMNRAVAFYRHFVGLPTDLEPPAAR